MQKAYYVYMLASERYGTLYTGMTSDLVKRVWQHRQEFVDGFTKQYGVKKLVWFEVHTNPISAIASEKQIKKWNRTWKIELIQKQNPRWDELFDAII